MIIQQDDRDRASRLVRSIVKLDPGTRILDDMASWNIRQKLLRAFDRFVKSLDTKLVIILSVQRRRFPHL